MTHQTEKNEKTDNFPMLSDRAPKDGMCCSTHECANMMKVLSDGNRLQIIRALISGPKNVGEISEDTGLNPQRVSHHLGRMRLAGLVEGERQGRNMIYTINPSIACEQGVDLGCCRIVFRAF